MRLTLFGETFLPRVEAILRQMENAKQEIEEMSGGERGILVVGSIPTIAPYFLPRVSPALNQNHGGAYL